MQHDLTIKPVKSIVIDMTSLSTSNNRYPYYELKPMMTLVCVAESTGSATP